MQDRASGAAGNKFGRECGAKIIEALGATKVKKGSNECLIEGIRASVHCARKHTSSVGVTKLCLQRLDVVVGAFEQEDGAFKVFQIPASLFKEQGTDTRSLGPSSGRVLKAPRTLFETQGELICTVTL
jgi:hypothetical protein